MLDVGIDNEIGDAMIKHYGREGRFLACRNDYQVIRTSTRNSSPSSSYVHPP